MTAPVTLTLTAEEAGALELATGEVPYLLHHAAGVFELLASGIAGGFLEGHTGVVSVLELSARALRVAADKEGAALERLDLTLRRAIADAPGKAMTDFAQQWAAQGNRNPEDLRSA